jgi:Domain of unknown function (DUF4149)
MFEMISLYLVAASLGVMLFFTVLVAPSIFVVLPAEWAAIYVRAFFPKYYRTLGVVAVLASILSGATMESYALILSASIFLFSLWLTPKINHAKDTQQHTLFNRLHILSVALNLLVILIYVWVLYDTYASHQYT